MEKAKVLKIVQIVFFLLHGRLVVIVVVLVLHYSNY